MVAASRVGRPCYPGSQPMRGPLTKAFIRDFLRIAPSGGGKAVLTLHKTNAYTT